MIYFRIHKKTTICVCRVIIFFIFLFSPLRVTARNYTVGEPACDTIVSNMRYDAPNCPTGSLLILLDREGRQTPYVTGLNFQVEITAIHGAVSSNVSDSVQVGDIFLLPAPNDSGALKISLPEGNGFFEFLIKIVGTPTVAGESYYCNIAYRMTTAVCHNELEVYVVDEEICTVQSSPSSIDYFPEIPVEYKLKQNYPNPFNPLTNISYSIPNSYFVTLKIYDLLGKEIQTLVNEFQQAGTYSLTFDSSELSSGIYFYRLGVGSNFVETKKMLFLQ